MIRPCMTISILLHVVIFCCTQSFASEDDDLVKLKNNFVVKDDSASTHIGKDIETHEKGHESKDPWTQSDFPTHQDEDIYPSLVTRHDKASVILTPNVNQSKGHRKSQLKNDSKDKEKRAPLIRKDHRNTKVRHTTLKLKDSRKTKKHWRGKSPSRKYRTRKYHNRGKKISHWHGKSRRSRRKYGTRKYHSRRRRISHWHGKFQRRSRRKYGTRKYHNRRRRVSIYKTRKFYKRKGRKLYRVIRKMKRRLRVRKRILKIRKQKKKLSQIAKRIKYKFSLYRQRTKQQRHADSKVVRHGEHKRSFDQYRRRHLYYYHKEEKLHTHFARAKLASTGNTHLSPRYPEWLLASGKRGIISAGSNSGKLHGWNIPTQYARTWHGRTKIRHHTIYRKRLHRVQRKRKSRRHYRHRYIYRHTYYGFSQSHRRKPLNVYRHFYHRSGQNKYHSWSESFRRLEKSPYQKKHRDAKNEIKPPFRVIPSYFRNNLKENDKQKKQLGSVGPYIKSAGIKYQRRAVYTHKKKTMDEKPEIQFEKESGGSRSHFEHPWFKKTK